MMTFHLAEKLQSSLSLDCKEAFAMTPIQISSKSAEKNKTEG